MCGIHLRVWKNSSCEVCQEAFSVEEHGNLRHRGPDSCEGISVSSAAHHRVHLQASVLQMRHELVKQPVQISGDSYLCWNGEVYQALEYDTAWDYDTSDTLLVAKALEPIMEQEKEAQWSQKIATTLSRLYNAEFGFLILTPTTVYYGRDHWGRRSLLRWDCPNQCGSFQIVSTAEFPTDDEEHQNWKEILPGMVHQSSLVDAEEEPPTPFPAVSFASPKSALSNRLPSAPPGVSDELWKASMELEFHLTRAVAMRMDSTRSTAVLFSGGLDSAVVAALAARQATTHPLTLYNVSFGPTYEKSADRKAALIAYDALQERHSNIVYRDIVVDWENICEKEPHIRTLLQPKTTLMDINIATALWFASRGDKSELECPDRPRVLLLGMGADEQLGGYGRHRQAFERGGWVELRKELEMDQSRFWERNLGRDDRVCADHGKEARFPFLDPHVVRLLKDLPLELVCDFTLPPGQGDKRILRLVAMRLGLDHASGLVKRAIQFGSRISHLSDAKRFGSRRKAKGEATVKATSTTCGR
jgi:asparagine synthetase B (glutamine-hydrolysing)